MDGTDLLLIMIRAVLSSVMAQKEKCKDALALLFICGKRDSEYEIKKVTK